MPQRLSDMRASRSVMVTSCMTSSTEVARMGQPEDIANAALFLVSPAPGWVTGKVLGVHGGVEAPNF